jgi:hypothetical protein
MIAYAEVEGSQQQLRDIKGPRSLSEFYIVLYALCALVLCALAVALWAWWRRRKRKPQLKPARPAHEIAFEQLQQLKSKDLIRQGKIKEYYTEISDIIRHYLENRFQLKAPEMTSEEFLQYVRDNAALTAGHKQLLKDFLLCCDLVKFAKHEPVQQDADNAFMFAQKFVEETREIIEILKNEAVEEVIARRTV